MSSKSFALLMALQIALCGVLWYKTERLRPQIVAMRTQQLAQADVLARQTDAKSEIGRIMETSLGIYHE